MWRILRLHLLNTMILARLTTGSCSSLAFYSQQNTHNLTFKTAVSVLLTVWQDGVSPCGPGWPQTHLLPTIASTSWDNRSMPQQPAALDFHIKLFLPHSFLVSFPSPTCPPPCLNLKSKHQTTAPTPASHSAALACPLPDHSHGDQADVTVSVGGKAPQYTSCPATLHNPLIGQGPCGAGAQAAEAHLFSLKK